MEVDQKLQIKCRDYYEKQEFPQCPHGPTLFFHNGVENEGYYACAAFRNKRDCNFHLTAKQFQTSTMKMIKKHYDMTAPCETYKKMRQLLKSKDKIHYCLKCNILLLDNDVNGHKQHEIVKNLTKQQLADPTQFLYPLDDDKAQAQYFFDANALKFFENCFIDLKITKIICMGAPRLHSHLRQRQKLHGIRSYLLDLDYRFYYFFDDDEFSWYNMCNNYFFDKTQQLIFNQFLIDDKSNDEKVLIFTDPPFGCRTEPIANTLHQLVNYYNTINKYPHQPLGIFWIFPYFAAHYIQKEMPEMEMCDYKINYTNHLQYTNNNDKARKLGSPVRLFTNIPLEYIKLPVLEQYKYCSYCKRYTSLENRHCNLCGICPSKNGSTYRHCVKHCGRCVKPNYVHCNNCRRCTQIDGHNCQEYQMKQRCWICLKMGHIESNCTIWQKARKIFFIPNGIEQKNNNKRQQQQQNICLICNICGHNEQKCESRNKYILEKTFLGETEITFNI